jgi:hypothetical protein
MSETPETPETTELQKKRQLLNNIIELIECET